MWKVGCRKSIFYFLCVTVVLLYQGLTFVLSAVNKPHTLSLSLSLLGLNQFARRDSGGALQSALSFVQYIYPNEMITVQLFDKIK